MARQVVVLEQDSSESTNIKFKAAFWLSVPVARQFYFANATAQSAVKDGSVTTAELTALQNGSVLERVYQMIYPPGTTIAQIEADLQSKYATAQASLTAQSAEFADTVLTRYGSFWDGTTWTLKNN
jgi:hypothetical protein